MNGGQSRGNEIPEGQDLGARGGGGRVLRDVIQPFPTFSEIYGDALKLLGGQITAARQQATVRSL